jgi:GNAT superfamily N-acetyltransferase
MEILPITDNNLDDCLNIYLKAYNTPPWNYGWTTNMLKQYLSEYMDTSYFVGFILYDDSEPVGAVFTHKKTWWTGPMLFIDEFFITPVKQGMGYGRKLMDYCNEYASQNNLEIMMLMTNKYMPSYKFYDRISFTTADQFVFMFKPVSEL